MNWHLFTSACWLRQLRQAIDASLESVNRTDRLYAIVEELRASAPSSRTARELAEQYEVSTRTIERDVLALQEAGVPVWSDAGRRGGYSIDPERTLPPVNFSPAEALAVSIALADSIGPFAAAGRVARNKVLAAMSADDRDATRRMADRVRRFNRDETDGSPQISIAVQRAISERAVVEIDYLTRAKSKTTREVEPIGVVALDDDWFLVGWCRLRDAARTFRIDRIGDARLTGEVAPDRNLEHFLEIASLPERDSPLA